MVEIWKIVDEKISSLIYLEKFEPLWLILF